MPSGNAQQAARAHTVRLNDTDDVVIARGQLISGTWIPEENITVSGLVPPGHKVATRDIQAGEPVRRYGQVIGFASASIRSGQHVHTHNLEMGAFDRGAAEAAGLDAEVLQREQQPATFLGIVRPDGRVGTRNYIAVLTSVNCSATVARAVSDYFRRDIRPEALAAYPQVDGVVSLTHAAGCAVDSQGEGLRVLRRTLAGYAVHANFAAVLVIGLGCETNQISSWAEQEGLTFGGNLRTLNIQDVGGTPRAVELGIEIIQSLLPQANEVQRQEVSLRHLIVGLQCGGSDSYSGITANPALGAAVDRVVRHGGTAILSETPEIYGAEHLLIRRAQSKEVSDKLLARIRWWEEYCARMGTNLNNNPSAGNKAGGLTTILEKSLGAVAKGGSTNLVDVLEYAQPVKHAGLVFMDTPGYDPVSATGQVAGGANLICFTTGRGSAYGCAPAPSLKIATNNQLWIRQQADMDINCGTIAEGEESVESMGEAIFQLILRIASGEKTKSELFGYGQNEFVPWQLGAIT